MSNPGKNAATQQQNQDAADSTNPVDVNTLVKQITTDDEGNYIFPEGVEVSPELKIAATAEKRRRDTQSSYTQSQQARKALEAENAKLIEQLQSLSNISFTPEEIEELEDLKATDPEAWRKKLNSLEQQKKTEAKESLDSLTGEAKKAAEIQFELERRVQVLKEFNETLETPITDEIIASEIPPRITNKLENGEVDFETFLEEVATYLKTPKVVANPDTLGQPNLSKAAGGDSPSEHKVEESLTDSYAKMIF